MLMDDRQLVGRVLSGDESAFEEFFSRYFQRLFRFALRRTRDAAAAEDAAQATLVTAVRTLQSWRGEAALFTWLCTLCRHHVSAEWRRTGRVPVQSLDDDPDMRAHFEALAADADTPDTAFDRTRLAELVQITLDSLPGRYGDVLEWKYVQGHSVAEIAMRLGATEKAVESLLTRARHLFREGFPAKRHS
jgi:RNA polymerase sigma-70 factor (ECF subfamily)